MANTEYSKFFNKVKKNTKATWKKARKVEATPVGQGLPPGLKNAVAEFSEYKLGESQKGDPYVSLTGIVVEPENCIGRRLTRVYFLSDGQYSTAEQALEKLAREAKLMGAEFGDGGEEDWPDVFEEMVASKSRFVFNTDEYRGKTVIQLQGPVTDETEEEEEEEVIEDDEDSEEDSEELTPEEGDAISYKPPRKWNAIEMTVVSVDEDAKTVDLVDENDRSYEGIAWEKIEFVME